MSEWLEVSLDRITSKIGDGLHGTPMYDLDGEYYFVNGNNLDNGKIVFSDTTKKSSRAEYIKYRKDLSDRTILLSINGTIGNVSLYNDEKIILGKSTCYLNIIDSVNKEFIYYVLKNKDFQDYIIALANGSTIKNVSLKLVKDYVLKLPPLAEQSAIADILGALDDKIELNQRMNETLEAIAQALFKSWFVDFDPVKAKAQGHKPEGMDDDTAALFPSSLTDSTLGPIPEGWKIKSVGDLATIIKGHSYKSTELSASETALVTLKSFNRGGGYRKDGLKAFTGTYKKEQEIIPGELIVAYTDVTQQAEVIGKPAIVFKSKDYKKLVASLDIGIVRPNNREHIIFYYLLFLSDKFQKHISGYTSGTTVLHLSKNGIPCFNLAYPDQEDILDMFNNIVGTFYRKIAINDAQIGELLEIRDLLLPRLISGTLRVDQFSEMIEGLAV